VPPRCPEARLTEWSMDVMIISFLQQEVWARLPWDGNPGSLEAFAGPQANVLQKEAGHGFQAPKVHPTKRCEQHPFD